MRVRIVGKLDRLGERLAVNIGGFILNRLGRIAMVGIWGIVWILAGLFRPIAYVLGVLEGADRHDR